jgi:dienelactone hydrolase
MCPTEYLHRSHRLTWMARVLAGIAVLLVTAMPSGPGVPWGPAPSGAQATSPPDPAALGPHPVGVTRRGFARASATTGAPRVLDVLIWYPAAPSARPADERLAGVIDAMPSRASAPYPVVVFSTGGGGLPEYTTSLTPHLASHGFVVIATSHPGTSPVPCPVTPCVPPQTPEAVEWLAEMYANRPDDIRFLRAELLRLGHGADALLDGLLDDGRMGMAGYSAGGRTTLQVLAENPGFRAGVAMASAGGQLAEVREAAAQVAVPMMLLSGERDHLATIDRQQALFETLTRAPERWWVVFPRGGHGQFTNSCAGGEGPPVARRICRRPRRTR